MSPAHDRHDGRNMHSPLSPYMCEIHGSDTWVLADAIVTIVTAVLTIVVVFLRHPFVTAILGVMGAAALGFMS